MKKKTNEDFVKELFKKYGNKYDYSKVEYKNSKTKVRVVCPKHGEFLVTPNNLLNGHECPKCKGGIVLSQKEFIEKAKKIHYDKYDYSKVEYVNSHTKVCIMCHKHGEFFIRPNDLLNGVGCKKCGDLNKGVYHISNNKNFTERAKQIHGDKYDYSKVEYVNNHTKVCIICPEHGEFWQTPKNHLSGDGCPICGESKLERQVRKLLKNNNIEFIYQYRNKWLGKQSLDFYLPNHNIAIECQGMQHFEPIDFAGKGYEWAKKYFSYVQKMDKLKNKKCKNQKVNLIYFSNIVSENIINEENKLLLEINRNDEQNKL